MNRSIRVVIAAVLMVCALPIGAQAGEYVVHSCRLPDGRPAPTDDWAPVGSGAKSLHTQSCQTGSAIEVALLRWPLAPAEPQYGWRYDAGPAEIRGASVELSGRSAPMFAGGGLIIQTEPEMRGGGIACGAGTVCGARRVDFTRSDFASGSHSWTVRLGCFSPSSQWCVGDGSSNTLGHASVHAASFTLGEDAPPQVVATRGALAPSASAALSLLVRDDFSGVSHASVEVDGRDVPQSLLNEPEGECKPVGLVGATRAYARRQPCPLERRFELSLAGAVLAEGRHALRAQVFDAAGNATDVARTSIVVVAQQSASAQVARRLTASFGRTVRLTGSLQTVAGVPVAGTKVTLRALPDGGIRAPKDQTARTDAAGRYVFSFKALANSELQVIEQGIVQRRLRLTVRARLGLRAASSTVGPFGRLRLRGRIPTAKAKRPLNVAIEVKDRRNWRTIGTTRTSLTGRFFFNYRFRKTRRGDFVFRAVALPSSDLAVKAIASPAVAVRVR